MKKQIILILVILANFIGFGQTIKVTVIVDGDTFKDANDQTYRLLGINAPEINQDGGVEAMAYLDSMALNQNVQIYKDYTKDTTDIYRRHLVYVHKGQLDLNKDMILNGQAKVYTKYPFSREHEYVLAQSEYDSTRIIKLEKKTNLNYNIKYILIGTLSLLLILIGLYYNHA